MSIFSQAWRCKSALHKNKQNTNQPKIAVQTEMLKLLKAMKNQPFILLLFPVVHGPTCWSNPRTPPPSKAIVSSSARISVKKQTDKNATANKFTSSGAASCRELSANQSLN